MSIPNNHISANRLLMALRALAFLDFNSRLRPAFDIDARPEWGWMKRFRFNHERVAMLIEFLGTSLHPRQDALFSIDGTSKYLCQRLFTLGPSLHGGQGGFYASAELRAECEMSLARFLWTISNGEIDERDLTTKPTVEGTPT